MLEGLLIHLRTNTRFSRLQTLNNKLLCTPYKFIFYSRIEHKLGVNIDVILPELNNTLAIVENSLVP